MLGQFYHQIFIHLENIKCYRQKLNLLEVGQLIAKLFVGLVLDQFDFAVIEGLVDTQMYILIVASVDLDKIVDTIYQLGTIVDRLEDLE